jgi:hypothetical protein
MFTVSTKYVAKLKAEFTKLDPALFDKGMWQLCRAINSVPDLATSNCCAGHVDTTESGRDVMYVSLHASTEAAERTIATIYEWWCKFLGSQVLTNEGMVDIHHTTTLEISRLRNHYEEGELVYTYTLRCEVDNGVNNSERNINALAKSLERLGFLNSRKMA